VLLLLQHWLLLLQVSTDQMAVVDGLDNGIQFGPGDLKMLLQRGQPTRATCKVGRGGWGWGAGGVWGWGVEGWGGVGGGGAARAAVWGRHLQACMF
jgi:hypothetical protein